MHRYLSEALLLLSSLPSVSASEGTLRRQLDDVDNTLELPTYFPTYYPTNHDVNPDDESSVPDPNKMVFTISSIEWPGIDERHVNRVYTYGAPSVIKPGTSASSTYMPGLRIYNQDETITTCSWYSFGCQSNVNEVKNVDFAAQLNVKEGYHHPNMDVLIVRNIDGKIEYTIRYCQKSIESESSIKSVAPGVAPALAPAPAPPYPYQWWPNANLATSIISHNHYIGKHYEPRIQHIPYSIRGPALEYTSITYCFTKSNFDDIRRCIGRYSQENDLGLNGVRQMGYFPAAYMKQESSTVGLTDVDQVYILKNDNDGIENRKCIIAFQGSSSIFDLSNFISSGKDETLYCGLLGVHSGVAKELSKLTRNTQYTTIIKPVLETCHDVTCVGHSLGGSLCNLFTMCANQKEITGQNSWNDYQQLIWKKFDGSVRVDNQGGV